MATPTNPPDVVITEGENVEIGTAASMLGQSLRFVAMADTSRAIKDDGVSGIFPASSWTVGQNVTPAIGFANPVNIFAWTGPCFNPITGKFVVTGGGHNDHVGREVVELDSLTETVSLLQGPEIEWTDYTTTPPYNGVYPNPPFPALYPPANEGYTKDNPQLYTGEGKVPPSHNYQGLVWINSINRMMRIGGSLAGGAGKVDGSVWLIDPYHTDPNTSSDTLLRADDNAGLGLGGNAVYSLSEDIVYLLRGDNSFSVDYTTGVFTPITNVSLAVTRDSCCVTFDERKKILVNYAQSSFGPPPNIGNPVHTITHLETGVVDLIAQTAIDADAAYGDFVPEINAHVTWTGDDKLHLTDSYDFTRKQLLIEGPRPSINQTGAFGKMRWVKQLQSLVTMASMLTPAYRLDINVLDFILPYYRNYDITVPNNPNLDIGGQGGERFEIGLYTEYQAAYIKGGMSDTALRDLIILQADNLLSLNWFSLTDMVAAGLSFSHVPNAFWLPYLITKDPKYIAPMRGMFQIFQEYRLNLPQGPLRALNGRQLAWQLRNLVQLAWLERIGDIDSGNFYEVALENTRLSLLDIMANPRANGFNILGLNLTPSAADFTGWMESYIAQVLGHVKLLGYSNWQSVIDYHAQYFIKTLAGPLAHADRDHIDLDSVPEIPLPSLGNDNDRVLSAGKHVYIKTAGAWIYSENIQNPTLLSPYAEWLNAGNTGTEADFLQYLEDNDGVVGNTWYSNDGAPANFNSHLNNPRTAGPFSGDGDIQRAASRHAHIYSGQLDNSVLWPFQSTIASNFLVPRADREGNSVLAPKGFVPTTNDVQLSFKERIQNFRSGIAMLERVGAAAITGSFTIVDNAVTEAEVRRSNPIPDLRYSITPTQE